MRPPKGIYISCLGVDGIHSHLEGCDGTTESLCSQRRRESRSLSNSVRPKRVDGKGLLSDDWRLKAKQIAKVKNSKVYDRYGKLYTGGCFRRVVWLKAGGTQQEVDEIIGEAKAKSLSIVHRNAAAKLLRAAGKYDEAEKIDGQKDLHPIFDLARQLESTQIELQEVKAIIANIRGGQREMSPDEKNMVNRFRVFLSSIGASSKKEHKGIDVLALWSGLWLIGEAKFIKKGGLSETAAVHDCLKVLKYKWDFQEGQSTAFALFNHRISDDATKFLVALGISVVVENENTFEIQNSTSVGLLGLFGALREAA